MEKPPIVRKIIFNFSVGPLELPSVEGTLTLFDASKEEEVIALVRRAVYRGLTDGCQRERGSSRIYTKWGRFDY